MAHGKFCWFFVSFTLGKASTLWAFQCKNIVHSTIVFVGSVYHNVHMESKFCSEFACLIIVSSLYLKAYQIHQRLVTFCLYVINWQLIRGFQTAYLTFVTTNLRGIRIRYTIFYYNSVYRRELTINNWFI